MATQDQASISDTSADEYLDSRSDYSTLKQRRDSLEAVVPTAMGRLYTPLQRWQTRILKLHHGSGTDVLRGELFVADVVYTEGLGLRETGETVTYEAVSYVWGESVFTSAIVVNGQITAITPTLEAALRRFRYDDGVRYLWAAALCIDQRNDEEKTDQVLQMFDIYRKAAAVRVWLGEGSSETDWLLYYIYGPEASFGDMIPGSVDDRLSKAVRELCCNPWAARAWVQQEVFAARKITLYCGVHEFTLETYKKIGRQLSACPEAFLVTKGWSVTDVRAACTALQNLEQAGIRKLAVRDILRDDLDVRTELIDLDAMLEEDSSTSMQLESVLFHGRSLKATDMRDKVYALLTLTTCRISSDAHQDDRLRPPSLLVDYSRPLVVVYQDVAKYFINRDRNLDVLRIHGTEREGGDRHPGLPTWTPDWADLERYETLSSRPLGLHSPRIDGSTVLSRGKHDSSVEWQDLKDIGALRFHGYVVGMIKARVTRPVESEGWLDTSSSLLKHSTRNPGLRQTAVPQCAPTGWEYYSATSCPHAEETWFHEDHPLGTALGMFALSRGAETGDIVAMLDSLDQLVVLRRSTAGPGPRLFNVYWPYVVSFVATAVGVDDDLQHLKTHVRDVSHLPSRQPFTIC